MNLHLWNHEQTGAMSCQQKFCMKVIRHGRLIVMDEFMIPSASGEGGLLFYGRLPTDKTQPIQSFWLRITDHNLSATGQVYAGYCSSHPVPLFEEMARQWSGWPGKLSWASLEGELEIYGSHDRLGHITIRIELCSSTLSDNWIVAATVMAEAGQLEDIARRAALFFGRAS